MLTNITYVVKMIQTMDKKSGRRNNDLPECTAEGIYKRILGNDFDSIIMQKCQQEMRKNGKRMGGT